MPMIDSQDLSFRSSTSKSPVSQANRFMRPTLMVLLMPRRFPTHRTRGRRTRLPSRGLLRLLWFSGAFTTKTLRPWCGTTNQLSRRLQWTWEISRIRGAASRRLMTKTPLLPRNAKAPCRSPSSALVSSPTRYVFRLIFAHYGREVCSRFVAFCCTLDESVTQAVVRGLRLVWNVGR